VFSVSRYGSATVRFTVRRTSLQTQVLLLRLSSLATITTTVVAVTTIVVVVVATTAERTSNCHSLYTKKLNSNVQLLFFIVFS
jgi:hypothetical protein